MNEQVERRVGTIIGGKWRVDALLGSGSMAAVYAVTHRNGARAALKILHPTLCTDPAVCERFLGEGYLANSIKHNGVVRVLDDGVTDDGCVFLVMDLLEGKTLEAYRQDRGGRIPMVEALDLADKLMDVLAAVHGGGIIHRDLKPQNVFVCDDGSVKLLDFGVARVFDRGQSSGVSMFGLVLGTPSFMSPEQALGSRDKVDHRSDIWSLGATMFTALTGETVHLGANMQAKLLAAATVKARSIAMVMPDLPPGIASAIDMALRFKKEDRWQNVDAMRRAIREARAAAGLGKPQSIAPPGYDMSLDETTHQDKGGPSFDGSETIKAVSPPVGTLPGVGGSSPPPSGPSSGPRPPMKSIPPPLPARARMGSMPPAGEVKNQTAIGIGPIATPGHALAPRPPTPGAVVRRIPGPDPLRASRPDVQEGSIPAYGGGDTHDPDVLNAGMPRKSSGGGFWIVAALVALAVIGGVGFFAMRRSPANGGASGDPDTSFTAATTTTMTTATATIPTAIVTNTPMVAVTAPTSMVPVTAPDTTPTTQKDAGFRRTTGATGTRRPKGPPNGTADAPPTLDPTKPPALPPDPFGTPE